MGSVPRPLLALLVAVIAFFGVWMVALRPSSSDSGSSGSSPSTAASGPTLPGMKGLESAISKAHAAVATSNAASIAHGGTVVTTPSARAAPHGSSGASTATGASVQPTAVSGAARRFGVVAAALQARKVVALLFYNPLGSDDRAVAQELALVPRHGGRVVSLAVPLSELNLYKMVTTQVPVQVSPTLVLIDPARQATTIVGYTTDFEISQRVDDALLVG
jgi:hypothetical protein